MSMYIPKRDEVDTTPPLRKELENIVMHSPKFKCKFSLVELVKKIHVVRKKYNKRHFEDYVNRLEKVYDTYFQSQISEFNERTKENYLTVPLFAYESAKQGAMMLTLRYARMFGGYRTPKTGHVVSAGTFEETPSYPRIKAITDK